MIAKLAKSERIEVRATRGAKLRLQRAASLRHKSVTEFLLDAALQEAAMVLADQRTFQLSRGAWKKFQNMLARPAQAKPELIELFREKSVLE